MRRSCNTFPIGQHGWSGRLDSNQRPPHPQCDALPGCATPRRLAHLGSAIRQGKVQREERGAAEAKRQIGQVGWAAADAAPCRAGAVSARRAGRIADPGQPRLARAARGTTVYLADNGIHADIIMPVDAQGLDWAPLFPAGDFAAATPLPAGSRSASGEKRVYLDTPPWWDIPPRTVWSALAGGERVIHVEYVPSPLCGARRSASGPRNIAGCGPRSAPTSRSTRMAGRSDRPSRLRPRRRFLPRNRQGQRGGTCNSWAADACGSPGSRPVCGHRSSRGSSGATATDGALGST